MRERLLDFIVCPHCRAALRPVAFRSEGAELVDGKLVCEACASEFPVIDGIPRLLGADLFASLASRHHDFFARHPEFLGATRASSDPLADTLESFTRQRLDLGPPGPEVAHQWPAHLGRHP